MVPNLNVQEIHDTLRAGQARYAMPERDRTDWCAMWRQRGVRLEKLAAELEETRRQRDMLATRCAEQAHQIAAMAAPFAPHTERTAFDAIATMQRQGIR